MNSRGSVRFRLRRPLGVLALFVFTGSFGLTERASAADGAAQLADDVVLRDTINEKLSVRGHELIDLAVPAPGGPFAATVTIQGEEYLLDLAPRSMRSPKFEVLIQVADGSLQHAEVEAPKTYAGEVVGVPGGIVAASVLEDGLHAMIQMPDVVYYIEPLSFVVAGMDGDVHVAYDKGDVIDHGKSCGGAIGVNLPQPQGGGGGVADGSLQVAEIACDADVEFYNLNGQSQQATVDDVELVLNAVRGQYETQNGISYLITTIIVRTAEPDPYSTTDPEALLGQFQSHWNSSQGGVVRDVAHLFTGKNVNGGVIGIAFLSVVCNTGSAYGLSQSRFSGSFPQRQDLTAHELGHNWSAPHCDQGGGCTNCCSLRQTMCSFITSNPLNQFSPCDIVFITNFRDTRTCLDEASPTVTLPFFDPFPSTEINASLWGPVEGATSDNVGINEPSTPFSLRMNGGDSITTGFIDTSVLCDVTVSYFTQLKGGGDSPESGDDLIFEYRNSSFAWVEFDRKFGSGADQTTYTFFTEVLPADAEHGNFQLRVRNPSLNTGLDDWFVDDISIVAADAVTIAVHPFGVEGCVGQPAEFTVEPGPQGGPFTYQWRRNGVNVPANQGGTQQTLVFSPVDAGDFGTYDAIVTGQCSSATSDPADLIETLPVFVSLQPGSQSVPVGGDAFFLVIADPVDAYQWTRNAVPIAGAVDFFLSLSNVQCSDAGSYVCNMTNECGTFPSDPAILTVTGECGVVLPAIVSAETVANHGVAGDLAIGINLTATVGVDSGAVTSESRDGAVTRLEVHFADPLEAAVGGLNEAAVDITPDPGVSVTTSLADGDTTLVLAFSPALPDEQTYTVALTDSVTATAGAAGDRDFQLRALVGNVASESGAGPQVVNAIDLGLSGGVRGKFGQDPILPENTRFDVNRDGGINATDLSYIRLTGGVFGQTAP